MCVCMCVIVCRYVCISIIAKRRETKKKKEKKACSDILLVQLTLNTLFYILILLPRQLRVCLKTLAFHQYPYLEGLPMI